MPHICELKESLQVCARSLQGVSWVVFCVKLQNCTDAKQTVTVMPFNSLTRNRLNSSVTEWDHRFSKRVFTATLSIFVKVNSAGEIYYEFYTV